MASTQNLDTILAELSARKIAAAKKAESDMGSKDTSHPSAQADNGTQTSNIEGARSAENTSDSKSQNPVNPDTAGSPAVRDPAGSVGVDAKASDEAPADKPDTSGKSDMGAKDTTHPSKSAAALKILDDAIKLAEAGKLPAEIEKVAAELEAQISGETEKTAAEKQAAEFAAYCDQLIKQNPEDFEAGYKYAADVLGLMLAAEKQAGAVPLAGAETPEEEAAEEALETPAQEAAEAAGAGPEAGAGLGEEDQLAALEQALAEAGVTPEELAAAIQAEGAGAAGEAPAPEAIPAEAAAKMAAEKQAKIAALKDALVADLKALKGKK